jgi:hypothetical protein
MTYRIILHVGPWKTGSTALQEFFYINRELLLTHGVFYPIGLVSKRAHHEIPNLIANSMSRWPTLPNARQINLIEVLKSYFEEMDLRGISTLLLSSEDFAGLDSDQYAQLITSLSQENKINVEIVYFEFDPFKRLKSYKNQMILQGEFVDSNASHQILTNVSEMKENLENFLKESRLLFHRINYDSLKNHIEIYQKCLDLIVHLKANVSQGEWLIPPKGINASIPEKKLDLLNEFNRLNIGQRQFDQTCPVQFSNYFPEQTDRFVRFRQVIYESMERDSAVAERDSAVAERDSAVAERDSAVAERDSVLNSTIWKITKPYRILRSLF